MQCNIDLDTATISNEGILVDSGVLRSIKQAKHTKDYRDIMKVMEPGDCLVIKCPKSHLKGKSRIRKVYGFFKQLLQRSPFSSIKMVYSNYEIIGYGTKMANKFEVTDAKYYLSRLDEAILMKHKSLTEADRVKIVNLAKARENIIYNSAQVVASAYNRIFGSKYGQKDIADMDESYITPLICSSIIAWFYHKVGKPMTPKGMHIVDVWPADFVTSDNFTPVIYLNTGN